MNKNYRNGSKIVITIDTDDKVILEAIATLKGFRSANDFVADLMGLAFNEHRGEAIASLKEGSKLYEIRYRVARRRRLPQELIHLDKDLDDILKEK